MQCAASSFPLGSASSFPREVPHQASPVRIGIRKVRDTKNHADRVLLASDTGRTVTSACTPAKGGNDLYWGSGWYVWNNDDGDRATLKNASGTGIDRCGYAGGGAVKTC